MHQALTPSPERELYKATILHHTRNLPFVNLTHLRLKRGRSVHKFIIILLLPGVAAFRFFTTIVPITVFPLVAALSAPAPAPMPATAIATPATPPVAITATGSRASLLSISVSVSVSVSISNSISVHISVSFSVPISIFVLSFVLAGFVMVRASAPTPSSAVILARLPRLCFISSFLFSEIKIEFEL